MFGAVLFGSEPAYSELLEPSLPQSNGSIYSASGTYTVPSLRAQPAQSCKKNSKSLLTQFQLARATNR